MFDGKTILITGGTGSFGNAFVDYLFKNYKPKKVIVFSRDEYKQSQMAERLGNGLPIRFFLGDIRDKDRLYRAFEGVDYVVHAAALKQVPAAEYNPFEFVKTNINGAQNIVEVAIDKGVEKVVALSTDKAVNPINLYGATKLVMEKIFVSGNSYVGSKNTSFSIVRYGNVIASRGSVINLFMKIKKNGGKYPITHPDMTRFWVRMEDSIKAVTFAFENMVGGEIFVLKSPSMRIMDLIKAFDENPEIEIIGVRPGEKIHETLVSEDEARNCVDIGDYYVILPHYHFKGGDMEKYKKYPKLPEGFSYRSDKNDVFMSVSEMREIVEKLWKKSL